MILKSYFLTQNFDLILTLHTLYNTHCTPFTIHTAHLEQYARPNCKILTACIVQYTLYTITTKSCWLAALTRFLTKYSEFDLASLHGKKESLPCYWTKAVEKYLYSLSILTILLCSQLVFNNKVMLKLDIEDTITFQQWKTLEQTTNYFWRVSGSVNQSVS